MMRILLTGSSGFVGRHIVQMIQADFPQADLQAPSRRTLNFQTMLHIKDWLTFLEDVDVVINCVGIIGESSGQTFSILHYQAPSALFRACEYVGVKKIIQLSALGADASGKVPYQISKFKADEVLRQTSISGFILQPSLIYGEGGASASFFQRVAKLPVWLLPEGGKQMIQLIHISDVVAVIKQCLHAETRESNTIPLVGNNAISLVDWLQAIRRTSGHSPALVLPISKKYTLLFAQRLTPVMPLVHPDNLHMLFKGNTADVSAITEILGRAPLSTLQMLRRGQS